MENGLNVSLFEIHYQNKREFLNMNMDLTNINGALKDAGFDPSLLGRILHIAGTNGKGSTSYFIAQLLEREGFKTALFTSPHITDIKERFKISLKDIPAEDFDRVFKGYLPIIEKYNLSFFEASFLTAAMWFSENGPDFTILETGLGGRLDATNTSIIKDKICVITAIGMDHAQILGNDIYKITDEKIAVIRPSSPVFLGPNPVSVTKYIDDKLKNKIHHIETSSFAEKNYIFPYSGNYSLAIAAAGFALGGEIEEAKDLALPPCRLETIGNFILDGSHNPAGAIALLKSGYAAGVSRVIFSSTKERDPAAMLNILKKISEDIIFTTLPDNPRMISQAPKRLNCRIITDPNEALAEARIKGGKTLITGSFFLCSYMKQIIAAKTV